MANLNSIPDDTRKVLAFWSILLVIPSVIMWVVGGGLIETTAFFGFFGFVIAGIYLYSAQEYRGQNKLRIIQLEATYGSKYSLSFFMMGQLSIRARAGFSPTEEDALGIGEILWADNGIARKNLFQSNIPILDASGRTCLITSIGTTASGNHCIAVLKVVGTIYGIWQRVEISQAVKMLNSADEAA